MPADGMARGPAWLRAGFVPELPQLETPVVDELRAAHGPLVARVAETQRAVEEVRRREAPADRDAQVSWVYGGGMAANPNVRAAVDEANAAVVAVCDWMDAVAGMERELRSEHEGLWRRTPRSDLGPRGVQVSRLGRFVEEATGRHVQRAVAKVYRAHGGLKATGAGVAW